MFVPPAVGVFSRGASHTQAGAVNIFPTVVLRFLRSLTWSHQEQALGLFLSVVSTPAALIWIVG